MAETGNLRDPNWEPSEEQWNELDLSIARQLAWRKAMRERGVQVLKLGLTPTEMAREAARWWDEDRAAQSAGDVTR